METIRWLLAGAFFIGALLSCSVVVKGLVTGRIGSPAKHSSRIYARWDAPDKFWKSIVYFVAVAAFAAYLGYETMPFTLE